MRVRLVGIRKGNNEVFIDGDEELDLQDTGVGGYVFLKDVASITMKSGIVFELLQD
jgi:hypothetical protein